MTAVCLLLAGNAVFTYASSTLGEDYAEIDDWTKSETFRQIHDVLRSARNTPIIVQDQDTLQMEDLNSGIGKLYATPELEKAQNYEFTIKVPSSGIIMVPYYASEEAGCEFSISDDRGYVIPEVCLFREEKLSDGGVVDYFRVEDASSVRLRLYARKPYVYYLTNQIRFMVCFAPAFPATIYAGDTEFDTEYVAGITGARSLMRRSAFDVNVPATGKLTIELRDMTGKALTISMKADCDKDYVWIPDSKPTISYGAAKGTYTFLVQTNYVAVYSIRVQFVKDSSIRVKLGKTTPAAVPVVSTSGASSKTGSTAVKPKATSFTNLRAGKKKATLKWRKVSGASGYQIQYSLKKNFANKKTVTIKKVKTISKTIKKLKRKKNYYFRIRTFKKSGKKTLYSGWSKTKTVKIK